MPTTSLTQALTFSNPEFVIALITFAVATYLGLAVYIRNPRSATHRLFLALAVVILLFTVFRVLGGKWERKAIQQEIHS